LQRTECHTDQLGNFLSGLSSLHQILDLLYSLWGELYLPPTRKGRGAKLYMTHFCILCAFFLPPGVLSIGAVSLHDHCRCRAPVTNVHWASAERTSTNLLAKSFQGLVLACI
jgi:hypothetical protein